MTPLPKQGVNVNRHDVSSVGPAVRISFLVAVLAATMCAAGQIPAPSRATASSSEVAAAAAESPLGPPRIFPAHPPVHEDSSTAAKATPIEEAIDRCVLVDMAALDTPGAQVAVVIDGQLAYQRGYGYRHRQNGGEVDERTIFRAGSLTKQFTAAAVMQQVEAGTLNLDDPITRLVPELHLSGLWSVNSITIWNLLTHTSGFPDNWSEISGSSDDGALAAWAGRQGAVKLHAPPGSFWNYTNPGYMLAGLAVERASGVPYRTYMENNVFAPAGMNSTTFSPSTVMATRNFAYGHDRARAGGRETIYRPDSYDNAAAAPAGYVFSTAADLLRWASLVMDGGGAVLSPSSAEALQDRQVYMDYTPDLYYGFGLVSQTYKGLDIRWHDGSIPGWGSVLLWAPQQRFAVALLANTSEPLYNAMFCIVDAVLQPEDVAPPDYSTDPATWAATLERMYSRTTSATRSRARCHSRATP